MASQEREQARADSDVSWNPWRDVMFNVRPEVRDHYYSSGTCNPEIYQVDGAAEHSSEVEPDLTSPPVTASDSGALNKSLSLGQVVSCGTQISTLGRVSADGIGRGACTEVPPWSGRQPPTPHDDRLSVCLFRFSNLNRVLVTQRIFNVALQGASTRCSRCIDDWAHCIDYHRRLFIVEIRNLV